MMMMRGDGVALDELRATVHRAVEVGLGGDVRAAPAGLVLVDEAGVQVGVDRHLLAGHGVEGEPGADLGDPAGTVGDDHELDDDEDQEDHQADDERAADDEVAERVDHLAGVAVAQHEPGRGDVERQPEQGRTRISEGKTENSSGRLTYIATSRMSERRGDVDGDEQVEQRRGQRHDQQQDDADDADRQSELARTGFHATLLCPQQRDCMVVARPWPDRSPSWRCGP